MAACADGHLAGSLVPAHRDHCDSEFLPHPFLATSLSLSPFQMASGAGVQGLALPSPRVKVAADFTPAREIFPGCCRD